MYDKYPASGLEASCLPREGAPAKRQAPPEVVVVAGGFFAFVALISLLVAGGRLPAGYPLPVRMDQRDENALCIA
jgi:hypothetical protein